VAWQQKEQQGQEKKKAGNFYVIHSRMPRPRPALVASNRSLFRATPVSPKLLERIASEGLGQLRQPTSRKDARLGVHAPITRVELQEAEVLDCRYVT